MLESIAINLFVGIICTAISFVAKKLWVFLQTSAEPSNKPTSKKQIHTQFLVSLLSSGCLLTCGFLINAVSALTAMLKICSFVCAWISFILAWGAFDAVLPFYPDDNPGKEKPAKDQARNST